MPEIPFNQPSLSYWLVCASLYGCVPGASAHLQWHPVWKPTSTKSFLVPLQVNGFRKVWPFPATPCLKKLGWLEVKCIFYWRGGSKIEWTLTPPHIFAFLNFLWWCLEGMEEELAQWDSTAFASSESLVEMVSVFLFHSDLMPAWRISKCTPDLLSFW